MTIYTDGTGYRHREPLPQLNRDLLEQAVAWAKWSDTTATPAELALLGYEWNQGSWAWTASEEQSQQEVCNTSFCLAGFTAMQAGVAARKKYCDECDVFVEDCPEPVDHAYCWEMKEVLVDIGKIPRIRNADYIDEDVMEGPVDPDTDLWSDVGRALLGLTQNEESHLFSGSNTIDDVIDRANAICDSRGLPHINPDAYEFTLTTPEKETEEIVVSSAFESQEWASTFNVGADR